jgi:hypothetical protein
MKLLDRLNFQTKIILITFVMILFVVASGALAIEKLILPVMEHDLQQEAWRVASGLLHERSELSGEEDSMRSIISSIFQVRSKLRYVEMTLRQGSPPLWMGEEKYRYDPGARSVNVFNGAALAIKDFVPNEPVYEITLQGAGGTPSNNAAPSVRVGMSAASLRNMSDHLFRVLFTVTVLILVVSFILIRLFTRMITRPVDQLLGMIDSMAQGRMDFTLEKDQSAKDADDSHMVELYVGGIGILSALVLLQCEVHSTLSH